MIDGEEIIGEIPADDLNLLEEEYRKALDACLSRRGMINEWFEGRPVRLVPAKKNGIYYVMVGPKPPTSDPSRVSEPPGS